MQGNGLQVPPSSSARGEAGAAVLVEGVGVIAAWQGRPRLLAPQTSSPRLGARGKRCRFRFRCPCAWGLIVLCLLGQASLLCAPLLAHARFQNSTGVGGVVRILEMPCEPPLIQMHRQHPPTHDGIHMH